ncbi:MAG: mobA-like transferase domain protein [Xanthomonadaceae bacterium]|nr:mobA-like transferase domain protein [Xanthomonadaceae bacterium]
MNVLLQPQHLTLGILAGGRATRLGGIDKAWLERDGEPQVLRIVRALRPRMQAVLVSANANLGRYARHGLSTVSDTIADIGPMGGLDALLRACRTPWLLTVPVDVIDVSDGVVPTLVGHAASKGSFAVDDDGRQPLLALWHVETARPATDAAISRADFSVHALQDALAMSAARLREGRVGNLNTPADLAAAGRRLRP